MYLKFYIGSEIVLYSKGEKDTAFETFVILYWKPVYLKSRKYTDKLEPTNFVR